MCDFNFHREEIEEKKRKAGIDPDANVLVISRLSLSPWLDELAHPLASFYLLVGWLVMIQPLNLHTRHALFIFAKQIP